MAELSVHNPLKVLHAHLEMNKERKFGFIGISNYELDLAKMSRFLVIYREDPDEKELQKTSIKIY